MDQYNTLKVSYSVKRLNGEYSQVGDAPPSTSNINKKVVTSGPITKLYDENKKQDLNKVKYQYPSSHKMDRNKTKQDGSASRATTDAFRPSNTKKNHSKKACMPKRNAATSPAHQRPHTATLGNTAVLPAKKNKDASGGGLFLRAKEPPLPPSQRQGYNIPMRQGWNNSTSGIRRDLLQISQDESISLYNTLHHPPAATAVPMPRPKSAADVRRRHGHAPIVRERRAKEVNEFVNGVRDSHHVWSAQTYDDETEDRARPLQPEDYRSHTKFATMLAEMASPEQEEEPFRR